MKYKRRHDLLLLFFGLVFTDEDKINYEISIDCEIPTVFCFCRRKDVNILKKNYVDIDYFTKEYDLKYVTNNHSLLAENKDVFDEIVQSKSVINYFKKVEKYINCIYLTDRKVISKE